jgi:RNA polymerase sigma factor (sigma-70 family)
MRTETDLAPESPVNVHQDLIDLCRKGDQKAQFRIYKLYYKAMYNLSLGIVKNPMEAEDIMQEAFLTAFEEIDKYSGNASFGAWLKSIVHNRSVDYTRRKGRFSFENIEEMNVTSNDLPIPEAQAGEPEIILEKVRSITSLLPKKARIIFSLFFLEGYDYEEISEILSISPGTTRSQLSRARTRFIRHYRCNTKER